MGSKGFKMNIDTSKLTEKDAGDHLIHTAISLKDSDLKTENQSFKLVITVDDNDTENSEDNENSEGSEDSEETEVAEISEDTENDAISDSS
jgi:hypothetical protein